MLFRIWIKNELTNFNFTNLSLWKFYISSLYLLGLNDYYAQVEKAEKELMALVPKIIDTIKNELLIQHTHSQKSTIERNEKIQSALDECSNEVWKVFEYEKVQRDGAVLNDWILCDGAIATLFTDEDNLQASR